MLSPLHKCSKYLERLSNTDVNDEKFGLYLSKLNYWYQQIGGEYGCKLQENCCQSIVGKCKDECKRPFEKESYDKPCEKKKKYCTTYARHCKKSCGDNETSVKSENCRR